jgi:hypothetical protein
VCKWLTWLTPSHHISFGINSVWAGLFTQHHYPREAYICNYIVLLDHLINTAEDVDLLVEKKVIVNWLGSNKIVANLINKQ